MLKINGRPLVKPSAEGTPAARDEAWMWLICQERGANFQAGNFRGLYMMEDIKRFASQHLWAANLLRDPARSLLPAERLEWIEDDKRQLKWLESYIDGELGFPRFSAPPALLGRNLVIARLDLSSTELGEKALFVERMEQAWIQQKQRDRIFSWFRKEDEISRCELAWNWLSDKNSFALLGKSPVSSYADLVVLFDELHLSDAEKILDINAIKRRWNQQKYRQKNADKRQCNLLLSEESVKILDKLAAKYGVSKRKIIDALIQYEAKRNLYLPEMKGREAAWDLTSH